MEAKTQKETSRLVCPNSNASRVETCTRIKSRSSSAAGYFEENPCDRKGKKHVQQAPDSVRRIPGKARKRGKKKYRGRRVARNAARAERVDGPLRHRHPVQIAYGQVHVFTFQECPVRIGALPDKISGLIIAVEIKRNAAFGEHPHQRRGRHERKRRIEDDKEPFGVHRHISSQT